MIATTSVILAWRMALDSSVSSRTLLLSFSLSVDTTRSTSLQKSERVHYLPVRPLATRSIPGYVP